MTNLSIVDFVNTYNRQVIDGMIDYESITSTRLPRVDWTTVLLDQGFTLVRLPDNCHPMRSLEAHKWCGDNFGYTHFLRIGPRKFFFEEPKHATLFSLKWP